MKNGIDWNLYSWWLAREKQQQKCGEHNEAVSTLTETLEENDAYQPNSKVNGRIQGLIVTRKKTNISKVTVIPGDNLCIGDLVYVFGEYWICMEAYVDEYGITHAEIWMCNHLFRYQDGSGSIIEKYAIIDDGSYTKSSDKVINVPEGKYVCYVSNDDFNCGLYIDKRLAIDITFDEKGKSILLAGKIVWLDAKSKNFGEGSHLLAFTLEKDLYNPEADNVDEMICNFIEMNKDESVEDTQEKPDEAIAEFEISGKNTIRIGTARTYEAVSQAEGSFNVKPIWETEAETTSVVAEGNGLSCILRVPLDYDLVGTNIVLVCRDENTNSIIAKKSVEVIPIG